MERQDKNSTSDSSIANLKLGQKFVYLQSLAFRGFKIFLPIMLKQRCRSDTGLLFYFKQTMFQFDFELNKYTHNLCM